MPLLRTLTERIRQALGSVVAPRAPVAPRPVFESFEPRVLLAADPVVPRVDGALDVAGEVDRYSFTVAQDVRIVFDSLSPNGNMRWSLDGPAGKVVDDRAFSGSDSYDVSGNVAMDLRPGDYVLSVRGVGDTTGAYGFRLLNLANASPLTAGVPVSGRLDPGNETDAFSFSAAAGQSIFLDLLANSGGDASWRLLDPFGRNLGTPRGLGSDFGRVDLPYDGVYTLLVEGRTYQETPQTYGFALRTVQDVTEALVPGRSQGQEATRLPVGAGSALQLDGLQQVRVDPSASLDLARTVTLEASVRIDQFGATWTPVVYKGGGSADTRSYSLWLRSDGAVHLSTSDGSEQSLTTQGGLVGLGEWRHLAAVIDRDAGRMRILVDGEERASADVRRTDAVASSGASLRIGYPAEFESSYAGLVGAVDNLRVWAVARTNEELRATVGQALDGPQAGLVLDLRFDEASGDALVNSVATGPGAALVPALDGAVVRRFDAPGQEVRYEFELTAAQRLYFDSLSNNGNLRWRLTGPRGTVVDDRSFASSDADSGNPLLALVAGRYTLTVRATDGQSGPFAFRLLPLTDLPRLSVDSDVEALFGSSRQTLAWQFEAQAGERYFFDSLGSQGTDLVWRLLDPMGLLVGGPTGFG